MLDQEEIMSRILEWSETGKIRPYMLEIRPTDRCNLRCPYCVLRGHRFADTSEKELTPEEFEQVIDDAAELGVRYVQIVGGGEPLLREDAVLRIMRKAKKYGMRGSLITNGTLLTDNFIGEVVRLRWDTIHFSFDAPIPEINDFLRSRAGCYEKAASAISRLARAKLERQCDLPRLVLLPVLNHYNCGLMADMVRVGAALGVQGVIFQPVYTLEKPASRQFALDEGDMATVREQIPLAETIAEQLGLFTNGGQLSASALSLSSPHCAPTEAGAELTAASGEMDYHGHPVLSIPCYAPFFYIGVHADGSVGACSTDSIYTSKGNVREQRLTDICSGNLFGRFWMDLAQNVRPPFCGKCCRTTIMEMRRIRGLLAKRMEA